MLTLQQQQQLWNVYILLEHILMMILLYFFKSHLRSSDFGAEFLTVYCQGQ